MNKLFIIVFLAVAVCSCHGISDRRMSRSAQESSAAEVHPIAVDVSESQDSEVAVQSTDLSEARAKKGGGGGGGHKNKMEAMHMGLSYIKMVISTVMAFIGHVFAFKGVALSLISVLIQIAQFVMALKRNKESQPTAYKVVETPWHTAPTESYGSYGSYGGHGKASPYGGQSVHQRRR